MLRVCVWKLSVVDFVVADGIGGDRGDGGDGDTAVAVIAGDDRSI